MTEAAVERILPIPWPIDLRLTLVWLQRGRQDLTMRVRHQEVIRATRTPEGPTTLHVCMDAERMAIRAKAWGAGKVWAMEMLPDLVGMHDDNLPFTRMLSDASDVPGLTLVRDLHRRYAGLRIPRIGTVTEVLIPVILEQKVAGLEAHRSYRQMVAALGEPAPGPAEVAAGLMLPPAPSTLVTTPYWGYHRFGVERKRAESIRLACSYAGRIDSLAAVSPQAAQGKITSLQGIGPWSAAEVALAALGDADAVSTGDFHLPHQMAWAFTGTPRSTDAHMLELLEPYRGQRGRVIRLLEAAGIAAPRRGPRQPLRSVRSI